MPKTTIIRKIKKINWIALILAAALIYGALYFLIPFVALTRADHYMAEKIDNQYVNMDFEGWETVSAGSFGDLRVPGAWDFQEANGMYVISGEGILAYGATLDCEDSKYETGKSFLSDALNGTVEALEYGSENNWIVDMSNFGWVTVDHGETQERMPFLLLYKDEIQKILLVFPDQNESDYAALFEIAEAIAFSYNYT